MLYVSSPYGEGTMRLPFDNPHTLNYLLTQSKIDRERYVRNIYYIHSKRQA